MQCLATFRLSTSPLHRHCYSSQQDELRARPVRTRIAGQRARPACAPALQPGQRAHRPCRHSGAWVRGCVGVRAHIRGAHEPRAYRSCARRPSACPALLLVLPLTTVSDSWQKLCPQLSNPQTLALFQVPQTLGVCGELMSNISATRGHPDMRLCVCGSPRGDLSHIVSLTLGYSRSDFSGANRRGQDNTCGGKD
jgi:hypothetical protein